MDQLGPNAVNSSPMTPLGFLERTATVYGGLPSVVYNETTFTWPQTHRRCLRLASALSSLSVSSDDVVSVVAPNVPAMYGMHFGVPMSGAILNTIKHPPRRPHRLRPPSPRQRQACLRRPTLPLPRQRRPLPPPLRSPPHSCRPGRGPLPRERTQHRPHLREIDRVRRSRVPMGPGQIRVGPHCAQLYVRHHLRPQGGGPLPPRALHRDSRLADRLVGPQEPGVSVDTANVPRTLPTFHGNGWSFPWGVAVTGGINVCLRRLEARAVYEAIAAREVTHICGAPVVFNMLSGCPDAERRPFPGVVLVLTAGAPPPPAVLDRAEALGFSVSHGYGLTETGGLLVSYAWKGEWNRLPATERAKLKAR